MYGSVGRGVASDNRGPPFKSSHRQTLYYFTDNCIEKTKIKKKAGNGPFEKHGYSRHPKPFYAKIIEIMA